MTNLSNLNKYYRTDSATAVAADIEIGKTAYVNGGKVTGTSSGSAVAGGINGIYLDYKFPQSAGAYTYDLADAQLRDANLTIDTNPAATLDSEGYASHASTFQRVSFGGAPAQAGTARIYQYVIGHSGTTPTTGHSMAMHFNIQDSANYWVLVLNWTSAAWRSQFFEVISGSGTARGSSADITSSVGAPAKFIVTIMDYGDMVVWTILGVETDTAQDRGSTGNAYYTASRPMKSETGFGVGSWAASTFSWQSIRVWDI